MSAFVIDSYRFAGFTPTDISGLVGWWDASDANTLYNATTGGSLVAADGTVARWEDKSTSAWHLTQSTSGTRPIRKTSIQNGKDVVRFTGATTVTWLSNSSVSVNQANTILVVIDTNRSGTATREYVLDGITTRQIVVSNTSVQLPAIWAGIEFRNAGVTTPSGFFMCGGIYNGNNSKPVVNGTIGTAQNAGSNNLSNLRVGSNTTATADHFDGDIAELLIYNSGLSDGDITKVYDYFVAKWAI